MKTAKSGPVKQIRPKNKAFLLSALLITLLILGLAFISYKYIKIRSDYGRILTLYYEGSEIVEGEADITVGGRHSAQKYMENVYQDAKLVEITESLGIHSNNIQGLEMRTVDQTSTNTLPDGTKPIIDPDGIFVSGYYDNNKWGDVMRAPKIEIESNLEGEELRRVLAHEFLHHMYDSWWNKDKARQYDQDLILFYINNPSMRDRLANYVSDSTLRLTEIYAYACTEYSDRSLGENLSQICGQWFDRSKLTYSK